jgi:serine/threonine protein phosphatase PrpC
MKIVCPQCNAESSQGARFCTRCGASLSSAMPSPPPAGAPSSSGPRASPAASPVTSAASTLAQTPPSPASPEPRQEKEASATGTPREPTDLASLPGEGGAASAAESATVRLDAPTFAALPVGELLADRRYQVVSVVNCTPRLNVYLVRDRRRQRCAHCGSTESKVGEMYCCACGRAFGEGNAEAVIYRLKETMDREMLGGEWQMARMRLEHPGMINLRDAFEDRPYGDLTRFYLASDPDEGTGLMALPRPQPVEKVLAWGRQIAEALAYLHAHGVRHRRIRPENVLVVEGQAKLTNFGLAESLKNAPPDWFADEVNDLACMLADFLAGQALPPEAATIVARATSADPARRYRRADELREELEMALDALARPTNVDLRVGSLSHPGKVRELNEDSLLVLAMKRIHQSDGRSLGLYAVADGMGGHAAGEIASQLAIEALARHVLSKLASPTAAGASQEASDYQRLLAEACQEANRVVYERSRQAQSDMGTTLVAALIVDSEAYLANVGDSRAYRVHGGQMKRITTDHSLVERLVATGAITREEARHHPQSNVIYRTIGDKLQVEVDTFRQPLSRGDRLVLCTDGLHGMVEDDQIMQAVAAASNPQAACAELVRMANEAGGQDNITVIVVQVQEADD